MGVRSTMSISIVINNDLWGLVACHHYGEAGLRVPLPIRELCRNIGECASTNIERLLMQQRIQARKPHPVVPSQQHPSGFITASSTDLVRAFDADFGLLSIQGEARAIGRLDPYSEALALLAHLEARRFTNIFSSKNIKVDFPSLKYPPGINVIAGLLVIPLSTGGTDFIVFFRKGQLREVRWAGNPYEKVVKPGSQYLEPRASFRRWTETVGGMSRDWTEDQLDTACILSSVYGRFIEIWRQKESAAQNNRLTRLLLRNSSHEVRTPLNAIVNYLEIALENPVDNSTKEVLQKAYKASRSLVYVIDDLLNLTKVEDGRISTPDESFDLCLTVSEVLTPFRKEAMRKNMDLTVSTHPGIPEIVKGDSSRLRQIMSNIIANAFQNSMDGGIKVDIRPIFVRENTSVIGIRVQDNGKGMAEATLDDLFQEFEQIFDDEEKESTSPTPSLTVGANRPLVGLGLALVARYVKNMGGQIRVRSELGKGTIFGIELPFEHAPSTPAQLTSRLPEMSLSNRGSPSKLRRGSVPLLKTPYLGRRRSLGADVYIPEIVSERTETHESYVDSPLSTPGEGGSVDSLDSMFSARTTAGRSTNLSWFASAPERMSVLIAEDNPINARLLSRRLLKLGHTVEVADNGQVCHDLYAKKSADYDVILMDIQVNTNTLQDLIFTHISFRCHWWMDTLPPK
jgi:light-regulated signal transduction histidine kinase (bacteriophytochrome)